MSAVANGGTFYIGGGGGASSGSSSLNYSTEEQIVGTWIDGKPLYQKTILTENPSLINQKITVSIDVENIKFVSNYMGIIFDTLNSNWIHIPFEHPLYPIKIYEDNKEIVYYFHSAYSEENRFSIIYTTIQYIKTTD